MRTILTIFIMTATALPVAAVAKQTVVDSAIEQISRQAKKNAARYEVLSKTISHYDPTRTNLFARPARASMQTKLTIAREQAREYYTSFTNQLAHTQAYSNAMVIANGYAAAASAKIQDEISDLQDKIEKYREYQTKYPLLKSIFASMITDAENRIRVLQSLTGNM